MAFLYKSYTKEHCRTKFRVIHMPLVVMVVEPSSRTIQPCCCWLSLALLRCCTSPCNLAVEQRKDHVEHNGLDNIPPTLPSKWMHEIGWSKPTETWGVPRLVVPVTVAGLRVTPSSAELWSGKKTTTEYKEKGRVRRYNPWNLIIHETGWTESTYCNLGSRKRQGAKPQQEPFISKITACWCLPQWHKKELTFPRRKDTVKEIHLVGRDELTWRSPARCKAEDKRAVLAKKWQYIPGQVRW